MKKLLGILGVLGLTTTTGVNVIACNNSKSDSSQQEEKSSMSEANKTLSGDLKQLKAKIESFENKIAILKNGVNLALAEITNFFNQQLREMSFIKNAQGDNLWLIEYNAQAANSDEMFTKTSSPKSSHGVPTIDQIKGWPNSTTTKDQAVFAEQHTFATTTSKSLLKVIREVLLLNLDNLQKKVLEVNNLKAKLLNNLFVFKNDLGVLNLETPESSMEKNRHEILKAFNEENEQTLELGVDVNVDIIDNNKANIIALTDSKKVSGGVEVSFARQFNTPEARLSKNIVRTWESVEVVVDNIDRLQDLDFKLSNNLVIYHKTSTGLIVRALGVFGTGRITITAKNAAMPKILEFTIAKIGDRADLNGLFEDFWFEDVNRARDFRDVMDKAAIEQQIKNHLGSADLEADGLYLHEWSPTSVQIKAEDSSKFYYGYWTIKWNLKLLELWGTPNSSSQNNLIRDGLKGYFAISSEDNKNIEFFDAAKFLDPENKDKNNVLLNGVSNFLDLKLIKGKETKDTQINGQLFTKDLNERLQRTNLDDAILLTISSPRSQGIATNLQYVRQFNESANNWISLKGEKQSFLINESGRISNLSQN